MQGFVLASCLVCRQEVWVDPDDQHRMLEMRGHDGRVFPYHRCGNWYFIEGGD